MNRSVYIVLFKSGAMKVGSASNIINAFKKSISNGEAFGQEIETLFFTERHEGWKRGERRVILHCQSKATQKSEGVFEGGSYDIARQAMIKTNLMVAWACELATIGNGLIVPTDGAVIGDGGAKGEMLKRKIMERLSKCPDGMTEGVLKNRIRGHDIREALASLLADGKIKRTEADHPKSIRTIVRYSAL